MINGVIVELLDLLALATLLGKGSSLVDQFQTFLKGGSIGLE